MATSRRALSALAVAVVLVLAPASASVESTNTCLNTTREAEGRRGSCQPYSGICSNIVGSSVYVYDGITIGDMEANYLQTYGVATDQLLAQDPDCYYKSIRFTCGINFLSCENDAAEAEDYPVLPCEDLCGEMWDRCLGSTITFKVYWELITNPLGGDDHKPETSSIMQCGNPWNFQSATPALNPPALDADLPRDEAFGQRVISAQPYHPVGYQGEDRSPATSATFTFKSGATKPITCKALDDFGAAQSIDANTVTCDDPLAATFDEEGDFNGCQLQCPYPAYSTSELNAMRWSYVVPGLIGVATCFFVLGDAVYQIYEITGGSFEVFQERFLGMTLANKGGVGTKKAPTSTRKQLRKATLYALSGSFVGILYFCMGPLMTLIYGLEMSCPADGSSLSPIELEAETQTRYPENVGCHLNRGSIFVLQLLFNIIFYSIVRIHMVVSGTGKSWSDQKRTVVEVALWAYTLLPLGLMAVMYGIEGPKSSLEEIHTDLARSNFLCIPRLPVGAEVALVYVPFIVTGVLTVFMAAVVSRTLRNARKKVADMRGGGQNNSGSGSNSNNNSSSNLKAGGSKKTTRSESDIAIMNLVSRLSSLGVAVFLVVLFFVVSTGTLLAPLSDFAAVYNRYFLCVVVDAVVSCADCTDTAAAQAAARPSVAGTGIQLFVLSCIPALFGIFYTSQAISRLSKDRRMANARSEKSASREEASSTDNRRGTADVLSVDVDTATSDVAPYAASKEDA